MKLFELGGVGQINAGKTADVRETNHRAVIESDNKSYEAVVGIVISQVLQDRCPELFVVAIVIALPYAIEQMAGHLLMDSHSLATRQVDENIFGSSPCG